MGTLNKVFILHGWTQSLEKWQEFIRVGEEYGTKPSLLHIPGLTEKNDEIWDLEKYVEWLKEKLIKEKKVVLIGHSNGGRIALSFATKYPEKLSNLILIDSAGIYHNDLLIRIKRLVFKSFAKIGKKFATSDKLRNILYKLAREKDYKNANPNLRETMKNLISEDLTRIVSTIKIPTLIIWGEQDKVTPLSDGKLMKKLMSNSKLFTIDSAQHSPFFTHPKKVWEIINENI